MMGRMLSWANSPSGLYKVDKSECLQASAHTASGPLTIMDAHWQLRHISSNAIKALIHEGTVTGLDILHSSLPPSCDSSISRKMMCKSSPKERTGHHADKFGIEVHTDVWGPSLTKSLGAKHITLASWMTKPGTPGYTYSPTRVEPLKLTLALKPGLAPSTTQRS